MTTPTQAAIEAARERLAKACEADGKVDFAKMSRAGDYDDEPEHIALAIALQEMSDAAKSLTAAYSVNTVVGSHLAPFILPDPVEPLRAEAIELVAGSNEYRTANQVRAIREGRAAQTQVDLVVTALRRGMELAKVQP